MAKSLMAAAALIEKNGKVHNGFRNSVAEMLSMRSGMIQRHEFEAIGDVMWITTAAVTLEFRRGYMPQLGRLADGTLDLIGPWPGLRPKIQQTKKLCPKCKARCTECNGSGKHLCSYGRGWIPIAGEDRYKTAAKLMNQPPPSCGGTGKVVVKKKPCKCAKASVKVIEGAQPLVTMVADPKCKKCGGVGEIPTIRTCRTCNGKGEVKCPKCHGSGRMSTGFLKGTRDFSQPECPSCEATGHTLKRKEQRLRPLTEKDGVQSLGPIVRMLVKPYHPPRAGEPLLPQYWIASADAATRTYPFLISVDKFAPQSRAAILGGILVPKR